MPTAARGDRTSGAPLATSRAPIELSATVVDDAEAGHLPPERGGRDPEEIGRFFTAAVAVAQRDLDGSAFGAVDHVRERTAGASRVGIGGAASGQDVVARDDAVLNERDGLLDHVFELTDVPGEIVVRERLEHAFVEVAQQTGFNVAAKLVDALERR